MAKPIALFYHIWSPPDCSVWRFLVDEQMKRIFRSGVSNHVDVFCCVSGAQHQEISRFVATYNWITLLQHTHDESQFEGLTLSRLHAHVARDDSVRAVGYIHTKGIRLLAGGADDRTFRAVNSWRHFLEWASIDRWRDSLSQLSTNDTAGVNLRSKPWLHYGGNFWWATANYIRKLPEPSNGNFPAGNFDWIIQTGPERNRVIDRLNYERWIGLKDPRAFSFYGYPFYSFGVELPPEFHNLYEHDLEPYYRAGGY